MKSSTAMLAALFVLVAAALFFGVYLVLDSTSAPPPNPTIVRSEVPDGSGGTGTDRPDRPDRPNKGRHGGANDTQPKVLRIAGIVLDAEGEPVEGATVQQFLQPPTKPEKSTANYDELRNVVNPLFDIDAEEWDQPRPLDVLQRRPERLRAARALGAEVRTVQGSPVVTDAEGRFTIEYARNAGSGPFVLRAERDGLGESRASGVRAGADAVELRIGSKSQAKGIVLTAADGHAVPNAYVLFDDGENELLATTSSDGRFTLDGVRPGQYTITAGAAGHPPLTNETVTVRPDEEIELRLPKGVDLVIRTTYEPLDSDGETLPLGEVQMVAMDETTMAYVIGTTDSAGRLEFKGLPPGTWILNGQKAGFTPLIGEEAVKLDPVRGVQEFEFEFEPTVQTPIRIVDPGGRPIEGVRFFTSTWSDQYEQTRSRPIEGRTDRDGRFSFDFEFDGPRAMIWAAKDGFGMVAVAPDDETEGSLLTVTMHPGATVAGTVTGPEGQAIPGAYVSIECIPEDADAYEDPIIVVLTDENGRYSFSNVPMGEVMIEAWDEDYYTDAEEFEVNGSTKTFTVDLKFE